MIYAPISGGTSGQALISNGDDKAPVWTEWGAIQALYDIIHPIGETIIGFEAPSVPTGVTATWQDVSANYEGTALWITTGSTAGTKLEGSLPNITGTLNTNFYYNWGFYTSTGSITQSGTYTNKFDNGDNNDGTLSIIGIDASKSDKVYTGTAAGKDAYGTVRPTSTVIKLWKRQS